MVMFSCLKDSNPFAATVIVYIPGCKGEIVYNPPDVVGRVVFKPVATFNAVTAAFGTTAPVVSVTVPVIAPSPPVCANAAEHSAANPNNTAHKPSLRTIPAPERTSFQLVKNGEVMTSSYRHTCSACLS